MGEKIWAGLRKFLIRIYCDLVPYLQQFRLPTGRRRALRRDFILTKYRVWMKKNPPDKTFVYALRGAYGSFISDWVSNIREDCIFVDVGANQGLYTLIAGRNTDIKKIFSFEPQADVARMLERNLWANEVTNATVLQYAISNQTGERGITRDADHSGGASLAFQAGAETELVRTVGREELSELVPGNLPFFVKIDVEGAEEDVLETLFASELGPRVREVMVEENDKYVRPGVLVQAFESRGFKIIRSSGLGSPRDLLFRRGE